MTENSISLLDKLEQNFKSLIIERCKFCGFDKYLEENSNFEFPKVTEGLLGWENGEHITIPGLFGGFDYFLEKIDNETRLYAEQSSRMDYSSDNSAIFEVTANGSKLLEGDERKMIWRKFRQLDKKRFEERRNKK